MTAVLGRGLGAPEWDATADHDGPLTPASSASSASSAPTGPSAPVAPDDSPSSGRLRRAWILPAAVVVAGALALVPTVGGDGPGPGEAEVRVEGTATVARAEGATEVVEDASTRLGPGDVIEITAGTARFTLADDVAFEGRTGPAVAGRAGTTLEMGTVPELVAGPLLVVAPIPVELRAAGSRLTVGPAAGADGAARIDRRLGLGVGVYDGAVEVDSAGRSASVAPLHRLEVASPGAIGRRDLPLEYAVADPWDRRFLADALLVDRQLGPLLSAFDATFGPGPATVEGLRRARPGLPPSALPALVAAAPAGSSALVTAVLADLGTGSSFTARVEAIQRFRDDGAPWGLVTLDRGVTPEALLDGVRAAIDLLGPDIVVAPDVGSEGSGGPPSSSADPAEGSAPAPAAPDAGVAGPDAPAPPGSEGGGPAAPAPPGGGAGSPPGPSLPVPDVVPPVPDLGDGPIGGLVDDVGDTVDDVVEDVGGAGPGREDPGSALGDVVGGLLDTLGGRGGSGGSSPSPGGLLGLGGR